MCDDSPVDSKGSAGAPENEIEVTPAMIEARASEPDVIPPAPAIEVLAEIMFLEFEHCDPTEIENFSDLTEKERETYRTVIERLLLHGNLIVKAQADLESPAME